MKRRALWFVSIRQDGRDRFVQVISAMACELVGCAFHATAFGTHELAFDWARGRFEDFSIVEKAVH